MLTFSALLLKKIRDDIYPPRVILAILAGLFLSFPVWQASGLNQKFRVVAVYPGNQQLSRNSSISLEFDRPLIALGSQRKQKIPPTWVHLQPAVPGKWRISGTRTLVFQPASDTGFPAGTLFQVRISGDFQAADGSRLGMEKLYFFQTQPPELTGVGHSPPGKRLRPWQTAYRQGNLLGRVTLYLRFNQPVDPDTVVDYLRLRLEPQESLLSKKGAPPRDALKWPESRDLGYQLERIPFRYSNKKERNNYERRKLPQSTLALIPDDPLPRNARLTVTLLPGMRGREGSLKSRVKKTFKLDTTASLFLSGTECTRERSGRCRPDGGIYLRFSNPVSIQVLRKNLRLLAVPGERGVAPRKLKGKDWNTQQPDLTDLFKLKPRQQYRLEISPDLRDIHGGLVVAGNEPGRETIFETGGRATRLRTGGTDGITPLSNPHPPMVFVSGADGARHGHALVTEENLAPLVLNSPADAIYKQTVDKLNISYEDIRPRTKKQATQRLRLRQPRPVGEPQISWHSFQITRPGPYSCYKKNSHYDRRTRKTTYTWDDCRFHIRQLAAQTDIALMVKYSNINALVYATSLRTGKPLPDTRVRWRNKNGKLLLEGKTNANGLLFVKREELARRVRDSGAFEGRNDLVRSEFLISASRGRDLSYVVSHWNEGIAIYNFRLRSMDQNDSEWAYYSYLRKKDGRQLTILVQPDRSPYKPGEKAAVKFIARFRDGDGLRNPVGLPLTVRIRPPGGGSPLEKEIELNRFGTAHLEYSIPAGEGALGSHRIDIRTKQKTDQVRLKGQASLMVAAFKAPLFENKLKASRPAIVQGTANRLFGQATYFQGGPLKNKSTRFSWYSTGAGFTPVIGQKEIQQKLFHYRPRSFYDNRKTSRRNYLSGSLKSNTDTGGRYETGLKVPVNQFRSPAYLMTSATVTDEDKRSVTGRTSFLVHPARFYIGIHNPGDYFQKTGPARFEFVAVTPRGKLLSGKNIQVTAWRRVWQSVQTKEISDSWVKNSVELLVPRQKKTITSDNKATQTVKFSLKKPGAWVITARSKDNLGNFIESSYSLYVSGSDFAPWKDENHKRLDLVTNKTWYQPGETARVLVPSPFPRAGGLLTLEREGVISARPLELDSNSRFLSIPITKEHIPNIFASVVLNRGLADSKAKNPQPDFRHGYARLLVKPDGQGLEIKIKPGKKEYRPGEEASIKVRVKGKGGNQADCPCEVTLWAVDEAVLSLTGFRVSDPLDAFYQPVPLGVRTADNRVRLIANRDYGTKGDDEGGGGGPEAEATAAKRADRTRENFAILAFYKASLSTDDTGRVEFRTRVPDNLTRFRVMALSVSKENKFGKARASFTVRKKLMIQESLPRFAWAGDHFAGQIRLFNQSGGSGRVELVATLNRDAPLDFQDRGNISKKWKTNFAIKTGENRVVALPLRAAEQSGQARLEISARMETNATEQVYQDRVALPFQIRPLPTRFVEGAAGFLAPGQANSARQYLGLPANSLSGSARLKTTLSLSLTGNLKAALDFLNDYPHRCLEQTTSRLVPPLFFAEQFREIEKPAQTIKRLRREIDYMIRMQNRDGGLRLYPTDGPSFVFGSAYAAFVLARARQQGYSLPAGFTKKLTKYLAETLKRESDYITKGNKKRRSSVAGILALGLGALDPSNETLGKIIAQKNGQLARRLDSENQALWLAATRSFAGNNLKLARTRNQMIQNWKSQLQTEEFYAWYQYPASFDFSGPMMGSVGRLSALRLFGLSGQNNPPQYLPKLARWLVNQRRRGHWRNTQESAWSLIALATYRDQFEKTSETSSGLDYRLRLGDTALASGDLSGSPTAKSSRFEREFLVSDGKKAAKEAKQELVLEREGESPLYYDYQFSYRPRPGKVKARFQGIQTSRYYRNMTRPGERNFRAGELVEIALVVESSRLRHYVVVEDFLPAGFEIVDPAFLTSESVRPLSWKAYPFSVEGAVFGWNHIVNQDQKVKLFANRLQGKRVYRYHVRAITAGRFFAPPATAMEMYAPDINGSSRGRHLRVEED